MRYLTFVVKGLNAEHPFLIDAELIGTTQDCMVFRTDYGMLDKIAEWFADVPPMIPGYGYPDGTCLIYSIHDNAS